MGARTGIQWTEATFNPWWGCTKVSPGCDHCYAERDSKRFGQGWGQDAQRREFGDKHWAEPLRWNKAAEKRGVRMRVFCASMADVFDKDAPSGARERLWSLIETTPWLIWQLLTKRIGNVSRMVPTAWLGRSPLHDGWPVNVWIGATIVNQEEADRDIPKLLKLPAPIRFLSCEPLLGPITFPEHTLSSFKELPRDEDAWGNEQSFEHYHGIDWVIAGGESGAHARPMNQQWVRSLRDQCAAAGVPFFFKQWGEFAPPVTDEQFRDFHDGKGHFGALDIGGFFRPDDRGVIRVGKKAAGRALDGREFSEFPV